jgi:hypothetical protein
VRSATKIPPVLRSRAGLPLSESVATFLRGEAMRSIRFVCLFAVLISILLQAQSSRTSPPNRLPVAQPWQRTPSTLSQMPQVAPFRQRGASAFERASQQRGSSSGLNFAPAVPYGSGGDLALSIAVADVNGDGKPDLVVANLSSNNVGVLLGNGDGTFQTALTYGSGGVSAHGVAVADVNGDGKPDILVANDCGGSNCLNGAVGVLLGNGDGTFQTAVPYASGGFQAYSVAVADVNGDSKPDLVVGNCSGNDTCDSKSSGVVGVLLGNGDGTFQPAVSYNLGVGSAVSVAVGDVNGDGKPDVVVANYSSDGGVSVLLGTGDGTFQPPVSYNSGGASPYSVAIADVNGDGYPDLLVANYGSDDVGVLLGNGDGTFQTAVSYGSGGSPDYSVAVADVNGDGKPDLVAANNNGTVGVLLGNGDGTFQTAMTYGSGGSVALSVAVADLNGDSKPDLAVANCSTSGCDGAGVVGVLINTSLTPTTTTLTSSPNPSNFGQAVTFTAAVTARVGGPPTGTVSFYDGTTNIGNSNLNSTGVATLTTSTLSVGTHGITATYNGDSNFATSTSPVLHQVVQGAIASLSPTSLYFGNQTVGITSSPQKVTLTNNGNINLTISLIQITGTNSGDFNQTNNCPSSLSPSTSCQISVTFAPTATGTRKAAVSITDNAPDSPQSVPLTGVGVVPAVMLSPKSLTFPTRLIFTTSRAQPVKLTNTGVGILLIAKISVTGPFHETNDCPSHLKPGDLCTISVKFHPTTKGVLNGSLQLTDNAPGSPQNVPLTGTSTYVQLRPTKLTFGVQPVGTRSLPKRVALTNQGHEILHITGITITGADAGDFAETNNCGHEVASGASCFIKVTFKPLVTGKRTADVSVYDNGGGSPQEVGLMGTGT